MTSPTAPPDPIAQYEKQLARGDGNLALGVVAGSLAAAVGAGVWAAITYATEYQIGFMAVGVGFLVGIAVRFAGKGSTVSFGIAGGSLSLAGCVLGNLLVGCVFFADAEQVPLHRVIEVLDATLAIDLLVATFSPMDVVFYAIAGYEGFRLSRVEALEADAPPS